MVCAQALLGTFDMSQVQIDRKALEEALRNIVAAEFPAELQTFDLGASQILEEVERKGGVAKPAAAPNEFGVPIAEVLQLIPLAVSAYFALKRFIKEFMPQIDSGEKMNDLVKVFARELEKNGFPKDQAKGIASRYSRVIAKAVKNEASS